MIIPLRAIARGALISAALSIVLSHASWSSAAQQPPPPPNADEAEVAAEERPVPPVPDVEMKPTELGLRFTPGMARAISGQMTRQMKGRYGLDDAQSRQIQDVIAKQMMRLAQDTQATGRDTVEMMLESMIENDGNLSPEIGQKFAARMKDIFPPLERFFTETAQQVSSQMTFKQRIKFTADSAPVVAGLALFKSRMEKWQRGEVPKVANPFFDRENEVPASQAVDNPNEPRELTRARRQADDEMRWQHSNREERWKGYVDQAIEYYQLDQAQQASARSILKEALERVAKVQTPAWKDKIRDNRIRRSLTYQVAGELSGGPWMFQIESEYDDLMKPLTDALRDMKKRIDALPTSAQRAAAVQQARQRVDTAGKPAPR